MRAGTGPWIGVLLWMVSVGLALAPSALAQSKAQPALGGTWRAGATSIDVAVESWGGDCGPRPAASRGGGGGVVTVAHSGKELVIQSRDLLVRSDTCWSRNPAMRKQSSSYIDGVWTTRCKTPANDPREESGIYTLKALGPGSLLYQDVSHYNWSLNESKCVATFTTMQTLTRGEGVVAKPAPAPVPKLAAAPELAPPPAERACQPGAPAQLSLRPKRVELEVGQRTCFRARVSDATDCVIPDAPVTWSLQHSKAVKAQLNDQGCFTAASSAAEAEGEFRVLASAGALRAEATVAVRSVDLSALIAKRMEGGGALSGFEEQPAPAKPKAAARVATRSVTERRGMGVATRLGIVLGLCAILAAAWLASRRKRGAAPRAGASDDDAATAPVARRPAGPAAIASPGRPATAPVTQPQAPAETWICPLCRLGYPSHLGECPKDGSALMPYSEFAKRSRDVERERRRRCPKCGATFPSDTAFCGTDGASLVDA